MTWGLSSPGNPYGAPLRAAVSNRQDFGLLSQLGGGGSGGNSSSKTPASKAAVSALTLLSFLFFLNMLQQQLATGQQQTLLFMVNNTNGTRTRRRRPLIAVASVQAKQGLNGRTKLTIKAMRNGKMKIKKRKPRDLEEIGADEMEKSNQHFQPESEQDEKSGTEVFLEGENLEEETEPPIMMAGLPQASALQLSAWLQGQLNADDLRDNLVDTLTSCRAIVACSMHKTAKNKDISDDNAIKKLLGEAGEYAAPGHLDEACDDLLLSAGEECKLLAKSFSSLLPPNKDSTAIEPKIKEHQKYEGKGDL